jgi:hypothetical protein
VFSPSNKAGESGARREQYRRRESMTVWIGAGLVGLIALSAGDLASTVMGDVPELLTALLMTCLVVAGGFLALARVGFEWAATQISRRLKDGPDPAPTVPEDQQIESAATLPTELNAWPRFAEAMWRGSLLLTVAAAAAYLVAAWWRV